MKNQASLHPKPVENQIMLLWMMKNGYFDEIPVEKIPTVAVELEEYSNLHFINLMASIAPKKRLEESEENRLQILAKEWIETKNIKPQ